MASFVDAFWGLEVPDCDEEWLFKNDFVWRVLQFCGVWLVELGLELFGSLSCLSFWVLCSFRHSAWSCKSKWYALNMRVPFQSGGPMLMTRILDKPSPGLLEAIPPDASRQKPSWGGSCCSGPKLQRSNTKDGLHQNVGNNSSNDGGKWKTEQKWSQENFHGQLPFNKFVYCLLVVRR